MEFDRSRAKIDPFALASFLIPFFIYLLTLAPSVTFFDSGEFLTAISSLGSAHSPGYPLFINYAKPFTYLPFGSIAFRINIATAVSASLACYGVYLLGTHILSEEKSVADFGLPVWFSRLVPLASALTFAFSARLWLQSNHDKPYPLIAFLSAMIFFLVIRWRESYREGTERPHYIYLGALLCGLATGAHQTIVLLIPSFALVIVATDWKVISRVREMLLAVFFGLLGFAVQLHMPVRAVREPLLNWADAKTIDRFLWHFLRKGYPTEKPDRDLTLLWQQVNAFNIPYEFTWIGLFLLLVGLIMFFRKRTVEVLSYLLCVAVFLVVIVGYFNTPSDMIFLTEEFFTPVYLLSAVFIGLGIHSIVYRFAQYFPVQALKKIPARAFLMVLVFSLPVLVCSLHFRENDQHENYVAYDYANNVLRSLPQGASLFTWGDSGAFPLWYVQGVERMREDLDLLHTPHLVFPWYLDGFPHLFGRSILRRIPLESTSLEEVLNAAITEQYSKRPVYMDFSTRYSVSMRNYQLRQHGITYRLVSDADARKEHPDMGIFTRYAMRGIGGELFFRDLDTSKAILIYGSSYFELGESLFVADMLQDARTMVQKAVRISPELQPQAVQLFATRGMRYP